MRKWASLSILATVLFLSARAEVAAAEDLYVTGPIEKINAVESKITVLGQEVALSRAHFSRVLVARARAAGSQLQVVVYGRGTQRGIAAAGLLVQDEPYVAGASEVALRGYVSRVVPNIGRIWIGGLAVDLNAVIQGASVGDLIEVAGTQPSTRGILLASAFRGQTAGSIGSGTAGSIGSGTAGSIGSGTAGSIGSGTAGSIGSGMAGSIGSGTAGSIGSGMAGSIGSGMAGSIGSGTAGSIGSGMAGSIGSGMAGSIGSGRL